MKIRPLEDRDIPILKRISQDNGYEYPNLATDQHLEAVLVVENSLGEIVCAAAAKRILELYLWSSEDQSPVTKMVGLKMLHKEMATTLRKLDYDEVNTAVPPKLEKSFGRRLQTSFGWHWNPWKSLFLKF